MDNAELGLYELLLDKITQDGALSERAANLVLAAWDGAQTLDAVLDGQGIDFSMETAPDRPTNPETYLDTVHVKGFRGVGPEATLSLQPGPGLTLVTGRNGSGKSSFAEAAELALTGECARWSGHGRSVEWRNGWRNLHDAPTTSVSVDLITAGSPGSTHVARTWSPTDELDAGKWTRQVHGAKRESFDGSEWCDDMVTYRPFLSYRELGNLIDGRPSDLHDALKAVLGLGPLTATLERLVDARKRLSESERTATKAKRDLPGLLADVDDDRARRAVALLKPVQPDLIMLTELVDGTNDVDDTAALRRLRTAIGPDPSEVAAAADGVRTATDDLAAATTRRGRSADAVSSLLRAALSHHDDVGDGPCPVCGEGRLDGVWRANAEARATETEAAAAELRSANGAVEAAVREARGLVQPIPSALTAAGPLDTTAAIEAWRAWSDAAAATTPVTLAHALETAVAPLTAALTELRERAESELARRDQVWAPLARQLAAWLQIAETAAVARPLVADLEAAEKWLAAASDELRDDRLAPFAIRSQEIWQQLRQQSNVELGPIRLAGAHTRRRTEMDVRIDGVPGTTALSVLSQGELHALGLSLFLPRATAGESPFRFVIIDDPVQAMDPAKVDGLARVLAHEARQRQILVFTHDDRLAEAVRRLELSATILEVQRAEHSLVHVRRSGDPVRCYLDDARAIAKTQELPAVLKGEVVASNCRGAIEFACHSRIRGQRLRAGASHSDVERVIAAAVSTRKKVSLALFGDAERGRDVDERLRSVGAWALRAFKASTKGAHRGLDSDLHALIDDTRQLTEWITDRGRPQ